MYKAKLVEVEFVIESLLALLFCFGCFCLPSSKTTTFLNYPTSGWGISLNKMPFFSRAEMDKYVARTAKSLGCAGKKSIPTGLKKAVTFLKDEYLKEIQSYDGQRYFFMRCKCYHSFRKNDLPHNVFLVEDSKCSCVAGALGYCNHS